MTDDQDRIDAARLQAINRGERAAAILNDPLVQEALQAVRDGVRDLFFATPPEAAQQREFLHLMDRARQQFEGVFTLLIAGAEVSRYELTEEAHTKARAASINERIYQ